MTHFRILRILDRSSDLVNGTHHYPRSRGRDYSVVRSVKAPAWEPRQRICSVWVTVTAHRRDCGPSARIRGCQTPGSSTTHREPSKVHPIFINGVVLAHIVQDR